MNNYWISGYAADREADCHNANQDTKPSRYYFIADKTYTKQDKSYWKPHAHYSGSKHGSPGHTAFCKPQ